LNNAQFEDFYNNPPGNVDNGESGQVVTIMHELGHTVGLAHTPLPVERGAEGDHIAGTGHFNGLVYTDGESVMISRNACRVGIPTNSNHNFVSSEDIKAMEKLYNRAGDITFRDKDGDNEPD
jgi:hypothetical protein